MKYPQLSESLLSKEFPEGATHYWKGLYYKFENGVKLFSVSTSRGWIRSVSNPLLSPLPVDFLLDNYKGEDDVR